MFIHHLCIQTNDYLSSKEFYVNLMGFELVSETPNFHGRAYNSWLRSPEGFMIELQTPKAGHSFSSAEKEAEGIVHMCFLVEDVEKEAQRLIDSGFQNFRYKNGQAVYEVLGSKLCKLTAPEGSIIELRDTAEL